MAELLADYEKRERKKGTIDPMFEISLILIDVKEKL